MALSSSNNLECPYKNKQKFALMKPHKTKNTTLPVFIYSKSTMETSQQCAKPESVQS